MEERKVQSRRELEEEMVRINRKTKWSGKDAGKLAADAIVSQSLGVKPPEPFNMYNRDNISMMLGIYGDKRAELFSAAQRETVRKYATAAKYAADTADEAIVWNASVLNALKDVELKTCYARMSISLRLLGTHDMHAMHADFIPLEVTDGLKREEYGEAMAAYFIENNAGYVSGAYDVIVSNLCKVLAWNLLAPKMAETYGVDAFTQLQTTQVRYVRQHILDVGKSVITLSWMSGAKRREVRNLFDYNKLNRFYRDYNALNADVVLQCEGRVAALLKANQWDVAFEELRKELMARVERTE